LAINEANAGFQSFGLSHQTLANGAPDGFISNLSGIEFPHKLQRDALGQPHENALCLDCAGNSGSEPPFLRGGPTAANHRRPTQRFE
jgi:hypothetical protein